MPFYVILRHAPTAAWNKPLHWDLLLEQSGVLRAFELPSEPARAGEIEVAALPDHRMFYLDYEGPIGGNRGIVQRWDAGTYAIEQQGADLLVARLEGRRWKGRIELSATGADQRWRLKWMAD